MSIKIQTISKAQGRYKVVETIGSATSRQEIERLEQIACQEVKNIQRQLSLFVSEQDTQVEHAFLW